MRDLDLWHVTLTFFVDLDLDVWPWGWYITTLMLWRKHCQQNKCLTSRDAKTAIFRDIGDNIPDRYFCKEHSAPNHKFLRLPVPKLWLKRWFSWFSICLTLTLTFQGHLIFENSPFVPLYDWCTFWSDMFINSRDIAHWNMEKLPMLYNGNFRCHGNVCYVFRISPIFCTFHRIGPSIMCVNFGKNRLNIDDFRSRFPFFINQPYHIDNIHNSEKFQMTLTFDLYLTLTLSLTFDLDDLKKCIFFNFVHFLWSHVTQKRDVVRQNGRSHANALFYKEHFAANQKSLSLPVQKLWPIMWFSMKSVKSRDVKTWRRTSKRRASCRSGIIQGTFCNQPEVSATSGSKVMAHYLFCTKVVTLTLPLIRFSKKKVLHCRVSRRHLLEKKLGRSDKRCGL